MPELEVAPSIPQIEQQSPKDRAVQIMDSSKHVLDETANKFIIPYLKDRNDPDSITSTLIESPRHAAMTKGGSALGGKEGRDSLLAKPELLMDRVYSRLVEVIDKSRDEARKAQASAKNASDISAGRGFWVRGDLVHSTLDMNLGGILKDGLLCSELHGERAKNDTTPLEVDFSEIINDVSSVKDATGNKMSTYSADRGGATSIILRFRRDVDSTDYGEESSGNLDESPSHRTVFVGVPSTEISGVQIVGDAVDAEDVKRQIIDHGQYIPVYDLEDNLLLTPEEFEEQTGLTIDVLPVEKRDDSSELQTEKLKAQLPRLARTIIRLAGKSQGYETFTQRLTNSNRRYTTLTHAGEKDLELRANHDYSLGGPGDKPEKVSIDLDNNRQLHVWEKGDGTTDLFVSSLDAPAYKVTEQEVPALRRELAKSVLEYQKEYARTRAKNKEREKALFDEDPGRG